MRISLVLLVCALAGALGATVLMEEDVWRNRELAGIDASTSVHDWQAVGFADPAALLELVVAVKQQNVAKLDSILLSVSHPLSAEYGRHLSFAEVNSLIAPDPRSVETILSWLESSGVDRASISHSPNSDFLTATVNVSLAQQLLHTTYRQYRHPQLSQTILRSGKYHVPASVAPHIDFVSPTVRFPRHSPPVIRHYESRVGRPNDLFVTPEFLRALYQVNNYTNQNSGNLQAFASFLEQYFSTSDLAEFFSLFQNFSVGHTVEKIIGANDETNPGTEAELDVQYLMSVGALVPTWAYYTAGRAPNNPDNEPFLAWIQNVSATVNPPYVFSVSYGEDEKSVGLDYSSRINVEFMKLGSRGISIMFASGDSGVGGNCSSSGRFNPNFPTGSPYVTSVGGVVGGTAGSTPTGETADYISGGGFSDYWARPSWQDAAVQGFVTNNPNLPPQQYWNASGRGYPDVAAQSELFTVVQDGIPLPGVGGTSCATPTFSGVVALLNDVRLQAGKSSLGFLNPLIYQIAPANPNAFNDVLSGANQGCSQLTGFTAQKGWDPVTGWGSPNFSILSKLVLQF